MHNKWDHINCPWGATDRGECRKAREFERIPSRPIPSCEKHDLYQRPIAPRRWYA